MRPPTHAYRFIGFTDEEKGEVDSHSYPHRMTKEEVAGSDAMVNMDTLGLTLPEVWAGHSDKQLTGAMIFIAKKLNLPVTGVNVDQIGSSDSVQFSERKIPSITIHSLTQEAWNAPILHTSKDQLSVLRLDDY
jgi:Zn-dependent M28 family amino/carboxypeptidase